MKTCGYCGGDHEYYAHCPECIKLECEDAARCGELIDAHIEGLENLVKDRRDNA